MEFLGADESMVMRTIVSWAWFRPSETAWDKGARWYRCDVIGGGEESETSPTCPRPPPACWRSGRRRQVDGRASTGPRSTARRRSRAAEKHNWRAVTTIKVGDAGRPLPRRPGGRGEDPRLLLRLGRRVARATRSTTTSATRGSTRPSGRPATAARSAGPGPTSRATQNPSLRSWRGSFCQSLATLTCRSR